MEETTGCNGQCEGCQNRVEFNCNPLARALGPIMVGFVKGVELALNTNPALLDDMEKITCDIFKQARKALTEGRRPLN